MQDTQNYARVSPLELAYHCSSVCADPDGPEQYGAKLISNIVTQAATDLTQSTGATGNDAGREKPINQHLFGSTFDDFLSALKTAHATPALVMQGFAEAIYESMYDQTFSGELGPDLRPSLLQLAHAAGLDQAMTAGFILVSFAAPEWSLPMQFPIVLHKIAGAMAFTSVTSCCNAMWITMLNGNTLPLSQTCSNS